MSDPDFTKQIAVRVTPEMYEALQRDAAEHGRNVGAVGAIHPAPSPRPVPFPWSARVTPPASTDPDTSNPTPQEHTA